jgi:UDP-3-O-[3-hydroxymyristoyl] glucosamine N-acyltransferase
MRKTSGAFALREIASLLGCPAPVVDVNITGIATLAEAGPNDISFLGSDAFVRHFRATRAGAVLVQKNVHLPETTKTPVIIVDDADLALGKLLTAFAPPSPPQPKGVDAHALIDPSARLGPDVSVGPYCVIGKNVQIGRGTIIHAQVFVGNDVQIGEYCILHPNVTLRDRIEIGSRVIINSGSVVGTDGFGYRWDGTKQAKIPQIGTVVIEDDVEIGSCVCVDRAKFNATRIGHGAKIDNLVQVAHNVSIGPHSMIAGQAGLAGSTTLGTRVILGGQSALRDHIQVGDGAMVAACAAVASDVAAGKIVSGVPALPHRQNLREQAAFRRLPDLIVQVRKLQEEVKQLHARLSPASETEKAQKKRL